MSTRDLLPNYWSLPAKQADLVKEAYSPKSFEKPVSRQQTYELSYWFLGKHLRKYRYQTFDDLIIGIIDYVTDACNITVFEESGGIDLVTGCGHYERSDIPDALVVVLPMEEEGDARGLCTCINERWRMQRKGDE